MTLPLSTPIQKYSLYPASFADGMHEKAVLERKFIISLPARLASIAQLIVTVITIPVAAIACIFDMFYTGEICNCLQTFVVTSLMHLVFIPISVFGIIAPSKAYLGCSECMYGKD